MSRLHIIYIILLFAISCIYADDSLLAAGNCTTLKIFNESANLSDNTISPYFNQTWCAANATQQYNVTNATLWANSSGTFNNATVSCLANVTTVYQNQTVYVNQSVLYCPQTSATVSPGGSVTLNNATVTCSNASASGACNFNGTVQCDGSEHRLQNVSGLDILVKPPLASYCYQNVYQTATTANVFRNDACNITYISNPPACATVGLPFQYASACPVPPGEACPAVPECPAAPACPELNGTNCSEVNATMQAQCSQQLMSQTQSTQAQVSLTQGAATIAQNAQKTAEGDRDSFKAQLAEARQTINDWTFRIGGVIVLALLFWVAYTIREKIKEGRLQHDIHTPAAMSKGEKEQRLAAGKDYSVFDRARKFGKKEA